MERPLIIAGAPGSPYTRKIIAAARYCRIPYRFISDLSVIATLPSPKVKLWPTCYFPNPDEFVPETDSTPLLRKLETFAPGRELTPPDPRIAFLDALIEDFADEWLVKAMFHYRWAFEADILKSSQVLPLWFETPLSDEALKAAGKAFAERQIGRRGLVGSNPTTAGTIEQSFIHVVNHMEKCLTDTPFLFGARPATADFGMYGQFSQLAIIDPTSREIIDKHAPRVFASTIAIEDLSGWERMDWTPFEELSGALHDLLCEIGQTYVKLLLANEQTISREQKNVETVIDGRPWKQPAFSYQQKCLIALRDRFAALNPGEQQSLADLLEKTGCMEILKAS
jgi:glutathione S-transferase